MILAEEKLNGDIRGGRIGRVYFLYGKEPFLVKTYTDKIINKAVGADPLDFNFISLKGNVDVGTLRDYVEGMPVFADMKVIAINDIDPEKMDKAELDAYIDVIGNVPETSVLLFNITGFQPEEKKAKTKAFIAAADKAGTICKLDGIPEAKIAGLVVKKAAKEGIVISPEDATYLTERVLCDMTLVSAETAKLMSYVGKGGTITRSIIDQLVGKLLDTSVYELAAAINSGRRAEAFRILDDLFAERIEPIAILSALSSAYLDFYRAKLAKGAGVSPSRAAEDFGYPKNREWALKKAMSAVPRLKTEYLRNTIFILSETDILIKSAPIDSRTILEQAISRLFSAGEKMYG